MGIYDRDYQRNYNPPGGFNLGGTTTLTTKLVIVMVCIYIIQVFDTSGWITNTFECHPEVLKHPLYWFQLLTAGFLHDPGNAQHIIFNMLGLWFFGRDVEFRYGGREYLLFFLASVVVGNLIWVLGEGVAHRGFVDGPSVLGASGGISAILILFALNFPHRTMLFMFVIPMPMWVGAIILVAMDAYGAINRSGGVAFSAHLGGALFAFIYFQAGWRLERFVPSNFSLDRLRPRPKLRVVDPDSPEPSTEERVDEILKKIQEQGRNSLTREERRILEEASQKYQRRRR